MVQPYLFFEGRCEEAIDAYVAALGAEVAMLMRVDECPEPITPGAYPAGSGRKILHARLLIGGQVLMVSDGHCSGGPPRFGGFALSLAARDPDHAARMFQALADGGTVTMPLGATFFSPCFGMVTDRFGVSWMVIVG